MIIFFGNRFAKLKGKKVSDCFTQNFSPMTVFFGAFVLLSLLFSGCDAMGGSINNFIDYNTGTVNVSSFDITAASTNPIIKTKTAWMIDPSSAEPYPGVIEFKVNFNNPQHYDLKVTPVIYEFIGSDGVKVNNPENRPISIPAISDTTATIRIGSVQTGYSVEPGDSFKIRLDISTQDGSRTFPSYTGIPQIIYDHVFRSAWGVSYNAPGPGEPGYYPGYNFVTRWTIQAPQEHVGINRIKITFTDRSTATLLWWAEYTLQNGKWENTGGESIFNSLTTPDNTIFYLPLPFQDLAAGTPITTLTDEYGWQIDMWDKNGLSVTAGQSGSTETYLNDLHILYLSRGETDYVDSGFVFNKDKLVDALTIPYRVERVEFVATKNTDIFGEQEVRWESSTQDNPTMDFALLVGQNNKNMTVYWKNPNYVDTPGAASDTSGDESFKSVTYAFTITRLSPNRDSTLKNLIVQEASAQSDDDPARTYPLIGGFDRPSDDVDAQVNVKTFYTVYVPSTVNNIRIIGDYLNTSQIYNDNGLPVPPDLNGGPNLGSPYPENIGPPIDSDNADYPDYYDRYPLQIVRDGWVYSSLQYGMTNFYINVKPEVDVDESLTRRYVVSVIRTDPAGNPNAKLGELSISSGGQSLLASNSLTNPFSQDVLNYTVNVPYAASSVSLYAKTVAGAEIREITSVDLDTNAGDSLPYTPPLTDIGSPLVIPFGNGVIKKRITLTVYSSVDSADANSTVDFTPKNYSVTLVRCLPPLSSRDLTGADRSLVLNWSGSVPGANAYEVYYSLLNELNPEQNIPELAMKWPGDVSGPPVTITGLVNCSKYNVWVRGKNVSSGRVGEWTPAPPGTSGNIGVPGAAELSGLSFTLGPVTTQPLTYTLSPAFSPATGDYTLTVPGATTMIYPATTPAQGVTITSLQVPAAPPTAGTRSATPITISVLSPDGKTSKDYNIGIVHLFGAPTVTLTPLSTGFRAVWTPVVTGAGSYEIYYSTGTDVTQAMRGPDVTAPTTTGTILGLTNNTLYTVWVRAKNAVTGPGDFSSPVQTTPMDGNFTISVSLNGGLPGDYSFNMTPPDFPLYWSANTLMVLIAPPGMSSYHWYIDDRLAVNDAYVSGADTDTLSVHAREFSVARHSITVSFTDGSREYSKSVYVGVGP